MSHKPLYGNLPPNIALHQWPPVKKTQQEEQTTAEKVNQAAGSAVPLVKERASTGNYVWNVLAAATGVVLTSTLTAYITSIITKQAYQSGYNTGHGDGVKIGEQLVNKKQIEAVEALQKKAVELENNLPQAALVLGKNAFRLARGVISVVVNGIFFFPKMIFSSSSETASKAGNPSSEIFDEVWRGANGVPQKSVQEKSSLMANLIYGFYGKKREPLPQQAITDLDWSVPDPGFVRSVSAEKNPFDLSDLPSSSDPLKQPEPKGFLSGLLDKIRPLPTPSQLPEILDLPAEIKEEIAVGESLEKMKGYFSELLKNSSWIDRTSAFLDKQTGLSISQYPIRVKDLVGAAMIAGAVTIAVRKFFSASDQPQLKKSELKETPVEPKSDTPESEEMLTPLQIQKLIEEISAAGTLEQLLKLESEKTPLVEEADPEETLATDGRLEKPLESAETPLDKEQELDVLPPQTDSMAPSMQDATPETEQRAPS